MLHPIFSTVLGRPDLIANHLAGYAALLKDEASQASRGWMARVFAGVFAVVSAMLALGLIGVAVMLGFLHGAFHWALVIVPGVAIVLALASAAFARRPSSLHGFADLRAQFDADIRALDLAREPDDVR